MKILILVFLLILLLPKSIYAHSGRTDSSGCHNCRTGSCAGEYHCHNSGSSGYTSPKTYSTPYPVVKLPSNTPRPTATVYRSPTPTTKIHRQTNDDEDSTLIFFLVAIMFFLIFGLAEWLHKLREKFKK